MAASWCARPRSSAAPAARPWGSSLASDYLTGGTAQHSRRIIEAYEGYQQLRVLKRPLEGVYLSFFLMMTLLILVGSTWMGLYLTKRVTRPIQALAAGARELGAGHLDHRIEPETRDEFGSLVEAFNAMADDLATSQRRLERSRVDLERKNLEVEGRRRYIEAILQRIATGVVSIDAAGRISTLNGAAERLLRLGPEAIGAAATDVFAREDLAPLGVVVNRAVGGHARGQTGQEVMLTLDGHELYLARGDDAARHRQHERRAGAGDRRRHAAHPGAEGRRLARRGAAAGARGEESADADSALRRATAGATSQARPSRHDGWSTSAPGRSSRKWNR